MAEPAESLDAALAQRLAYRLWPFARKGQFPDAAGPMRAGSVRCKPFRKAWTRNLTWQEEQDCPGRMWGDAHVFPAYHRLPLEAAGFRGLMAGPVPGPSCWRATPDP
ncbi:MAG: hypothetical protein LPK02_01285 [Rhodobacterales bacterium]|nr:hypothetical protein [Rhodobacterales bacterium]